MLANPLQFFFHKDVAALTAQELLCLVLNTWALSSSQEMKVKDNSTSKFCIQRWNSI